MESDQSLVIITQSDPLVLKLDQEGNIIWTKVYTLPADDEVYSIKRLSDGNLLLTGNTDSNVGTHPLIGANWNGLLMKINPSGDVVWATAVPARWSMSLRDSAEGPDGSLYAVGYHGDIVRDYYPSILVGKFTADGELIEHVLIGEDQDWEDVLPNGGDTPYDSAARCAWVGDSLVVVGNTGLGIETSAWVASLTDELGVRWFSAFDGPATARFEDLAVTDAGIVAMGWIDNPWPTRFENKSPAWLVSLPWEGMMRFHPTSGVQSHYLQPHVYLSSDKLDFIGQVEDSYDRITLVPTASVPFVVSNSVPAIGANVQAGVVTTFTTARLERLETSVLNDYDEWVVYYQLTGTNSLATGDTDNDGADNLWEFFTGTDPLHSNTNSPVGLSIQHDTPTGMVSIGFGRALAASGQAFHLQYSIDLKSWFPVLNASQEVTGSDGLLQWLKLTMPAPDPNHAFFRLELPAP